MKTKLPLFGRKQKIEVLRNNKICSLLFWTYSRQLLLKQLQLIKRIFFYVGPPKEDIFSGNLLCPYTYGKYISRYAHIFILFKINM